VAVAGVVASLSLAVALTVMVASFRDAVSRWLDSVLPADLYVRGAASSAGGDTVFLDPTFVADVRAFFSNFHEQYAAADLIIARSGATTVAEIKAAGRAAILVPFPFATDDHQTKNARAMADENAAILISNSDLNGKRLAGTIRELMGDVNRLTEIESNARRIAILDAETRIANLIEAAVERRSG